MESSFVAVVNQITKVYRSNNFFLTSFVVRGRISVLAIPSLTDLTGIAARHTGDTQIAVTVTTTTKTIHYEYESPVADPVEKARGAAPSLFLDQTEARRAEKIFLGDCPPWRNHWRNHCSQGIIFINIVNHYCFIYVLFFVKIISFFHVPGCWKVTK